MYFKYCFMTPFGDDIQLLSKKKLPSAFNIPLLATTEVPWKLSF